MTTTPQVTTTTYEITTPQVTTTTYPESTIVTNPESTEVSTPESTIVTNPESTEVTTTLPSGEFCDIHGVCHDCSDSYPTSALEDECAKCDNTNAPRFWSTYGSCVSCSDSYGWSATAAECAKCDSTDTPRVLLENGYCALESCGENQFQTTDGYCYSCSASYGWSATAAECAKCEGSSTPRYMSGGSCSKCPTRLSSGVLNTRDKCESCGGKWSSLRGKCS